MRHDNNKLSQIGVFFDCRQNILKTRVKSVIADEGHANSVPGYDICNVRFVGRIPKPPQTSFGQIIFCFGQTGCAEILGVIVGQIDQSDPGLGKSRRSLR